MPIRKTTKDILSNEKKYSMVRIFVHIHLEQLLQINIELYIIFKHGISLGNKMARYFYKPMPYMILSLYIFICE